MELQELAQYALYFASGLFILVVLFAIREMARRSYRKAAHTKDGKEKVRLQIIGKDGKEKTSWGIVGSLTIKDEDSDNEYPIENCRFILAEYPGAGMFKALGITVQKAIFNEGDHKPVLKLDETAAPTNITTIVAYLRKEKFIALASSALKEFQGTLDQHSGKGVANPTVVYLGLALNFLGLASVLYVMIFMLIPWLESIKIGLGI